MTRCAPAALAVLFVSGLSVGMGLILSSQTLSCRSFDWEVHELAPRAVRIQVELINRQLELVRHQRLRARGGQYRMPAFDPPARSRIERRRYRYRDRDDHRRVAPVEAGHRAAAPRDGDRAQSPSTKNTIFHAPSGPGSNPAR